LYNGRTKEKKVDNGFIYPMVYFLVYVSQLFNLVEIFKWLFKMIATLVYSNKSPDFINRKQRKYAGLSVDIFIVMKFLLVLWMWESEYNNRGSTIFVIYLLITNLTTYFYYHVWSDDAILNLNLSVSRARRRFINFFISVSFMMLCYGYVYDVLLSNSFQITSNYPSSVVSILYSVSNSFSRPYSGMTTIDEIGSMVSLSQTILMFIFISIILARSLPQGSRK
jgi:hypothetical protein